MSKKCHMSIYKETTFLNKEENCLLVALGNDPQFCQVYYQ